jgi:acyl-CoA synthetase (NDP forming)
METLNLTKSFEIIKKYGIKTAKMQEAKNENQIKKACKNIGMPIAMKVVSKKITHKTEAGGVKIGINSIKEATETFKKMKKIDGFECVIVQQMLKGTEILVGGKRDIQFGPTVIVGLGGIYAEILNDISIGICPLTKNQAKEMIQSLKTYPILSGARGKKGVNIKELEETILSVGKIMENETEIIELDLNPIIGNENEIIAVDARVITK